MKNLKHWLIVLPLLTIACTDDNQYESAISTASFKPKSDLPNNPANPYDQAGRCHNAVLDIYDSSGLHGISVTDVSEKIDSIASLDPQLQFIVPLSAKREVILQMVTDGDASLQEVIAWPSLGTNARTCLDGFVDLLETNSQATPSVLYDLITSFEGSIIGSTGYNPYEKKILLTTTSIVRFSIFRKRRKDKDWETSVGHIAAMAYGANEDMSLSVRMATTVGLCYNDDITH